MKRKIWLSVLGGVLLVGMTAVAAGPSPIAKGTRVEGVIEAIDLDAQVLLVDSVTVQVTPTTVIWIGEEIVTLEDLVEGMTVVACGIMDDDVLVAHRINVKYVGQ